jgi:hypothetical protein
VFFKQEIESYEDLNGLVHCENIYEDVNDRLYNYTKRFTTKQKQKAVWEDIQSQTPMKITETEYCLKKVYKLIKSRYYLDDIFPDLREREHEILIRETTASDKDMFFRWKELDRLTNMYAIHAAREIIKQLVGKTMYFFEYSDRDGHFWTEMEHGRTFTNIPHIRISHR